jgi:hypothetical protein
MGNQERTHGNKRLESKRPGVTKAGQAAPKLKSVLDHGPSPNELPKVDDTKISAERHNDGSAEPILRDNRQRLEPLLRTSLIINIGYLHHVCCCCCRIATSWDWL